MFLNGEYEFSDHASFVVSVRQIQEEWIIICLKEPDLVEISGKDKTVTYFFKKICEYENRVLRVAVNTKVKPKKVITAYFDRAMRGKI